MALVEVGAYTLVEVAVEACRIAEVACNLAAQVLAALLRLR